ncbi:hypothetical protein M501DRAFT_1001458, partial [Patellaria atrata CBS 101060]
DSVEIMDAELFAILKALEREKTQREKGQSMPKTYGFLWTASSTQEATKEQP